MPKGVKKQPWSRMPGEGYKAHELFMMYISMGSQRTLAKVAEQSGRHPTLCSELSSKFKWVSRATAYDDWMVEVQQKSIENTLQKDGIKFAQRRSVYRELEYSLAHELIQQGLQMVRSPLYQEVVTKVENIPTIEHPEGQEIAVAVTMVPTKWNKRDGVAYLKVASEIMRLSLEMDTQRVQVNVNIDDPQVRLQMAHATYQKWKQNIENLVDEQMAANPNQDRGLVTLFILEQLPKWAAADWKLLPEQIPLLTEGDDALPLSPDDVVVDQNGYQH
jgi:hypothetical protein